jgi:hypothetical protein
MSTEADALAAIAALLAEIRTANGSATEVGADVRMSPLFAELTDDDDWQTLVYTSREFYGAKPEEDVGIDGGQRIYQLTLDINIDAHMRLNSSLAAQDAALIKADVRTAMLPRSGRLLLDGVLVGAIRYLGNELIVEALTKGVLGIRTRVRVIAQQTVTHN